MIIYYVLVYNTTYLYFMFAVLPPGAIQITDSNGHGIQTLTMSNSDPAVSASGNIM